MTDHTHDDTQDEKHGVFAKISRTVVGDKRAWRAYRARVKALPESHRTAVEGLQRYCMYFGATDAESATAMFEGLIDLFERAAVDGTPVRAIVGDDPVQFAEDFLQNYRKGGYVTRERNRLTEAIARAESQDAGSPDDSEGGTTS